MYLSILILPLLGSIVSGLIGRKVGVTGSHIITISCLFFSSVLASIAFYEVGLCGSPVSIQLLSWIDSENMSISWSFLFDSLTVSMFIPVLYISTLIHLFSVNYMGEDPHNQRFFSYLSLFTFFMLILVSGANYFVLFVGWEGIGLASYLLINFWWTRIQANKAAILAFTMNRVGDMGLSIGFFAIFALFGSLDYATVFSLAPFMNETAITIIGLLIFTGAMAKSAQIPLHSWLPGSMEGPTPVSALIHAATKFYNIVFISRLKFTKLIILNLFSVRQIQRSSRETDIKFIPCTSTSSIIKSQKALKRFNDWLKNQPLNSTLNSFIDSNCLLLLKEGPNFLGKKDTGVSIKEFTLDNFKSNLIDCSLFKSSSTIYSNLASKGQDLSQNSLVYSFINKNSHRQYIGSTINLESRLFSYKFSWQKAKILRRNEKLSSLRGEGAGVLIITVLILAFKPLII